MQLPWKISLGAETAIWLGGAVLLAWLSAVLLPPFSSWIGIGLIGWVLAGAALWRVPPRVFPGTNTPRVIGQWFIRAVAAVLIGNVVSDLRLRLMPAFGDDELAGLITAVQQGGAAPPHVTLPLPEGRLEEARGDFTSPYQIVSRETAAYHVRVIKVRFAGGAEYTFWASPNRDREGRWTVSF